MRRGGVEVDDDEAGAAMARASRGSQVVGACVAARRATLNLGRVAGARSSRLSSSSSSPLWSAPLSAMTTRTTGLLPAELWDHVLALLPPHDQQHTALALSRALPRADPSPTSLLRHIRITRPRQALQAAQALRKPLKDSAKAIRTVTVEVWRDDQQLVVNLLLAIPRPTSVSLTVGPLAAPEHLEDLVDPASIHRSGRWRHLEQLSFRFNPYSVQKSYHTFLKVRPLSLELPRQLLTV